ncbi:hypothetical protein BO99DRAFT_407339, partial [Aspergillus violaceofuscus CBS 115571]
MILLFVAKVTRFLPFCPSSLSCSFFLSFSFLIQCQVLQAVGREFPHPSQFFFLPYLASTRSEITPEVNQGRTECI